MAFVKLSVYPSDVVGSDPAQLELPKLKENGLLFSDELEIINFVEISTIINFGNYGS
jgi:hypothetical protein